MFSMVHTSFLSRGSTFLGEDLEKDTQNFEGSRPTNVTLQRTPDAEAFWFVARRRSPGARGSRLTLFLCTDRFVSNFPWPFGLEGSSKPGEGLEIQVVRRCSVFLFLSKALRAALR